MSSAESVTEWLASLKRGNPAAAQRLWERYASQLARLARYKLADAPRRAADEEDVALTAFANFCQGLDAGRFPRMEDRDDLWQVLVMLTKRSAIDQRRRELAAKRGGGEVCGDPARDGPDRSDSDGADLAQLVSREPTPEFAAEVAETLALRLEMLADDAELQRIALEKLAGFSNQEIAQRLDCSLRSVERQLSLIRTIWKKDRES